MGSTACTNPVSSGSIIGGGVMEPVMMMSPADSRSPKDGEQVGGERDELRQLAGERFRIVRAVDLRAAAHDARGDAAQAARGARLVAEQHMALVNVAAEHGVEIVRRRHRIEIGKLDRRPDLLDRGERRLGRGAAREIARHAHEDLRLGHRLQIALERHRAAGGQQRALQQEADQRSLEPELFHGGGRAETELPAERLLAGGERRAARGKLRGHAFVDQRCVPGVCHCTSSLLLSLLLVGRVDRRSVATAVGVGVMRVKDDPHPARFARNPLHKGEGKVSPRLRRGDLFVVTTSCGSPDAPGSRNPRSSRRPSSPRPAPRLRSMCC